MLDCSVEYLDGFSNGAVDVETLHVQESPLPATF